MKQQEIFGVGSLSKIGQVVAAQKAKRIFLVTGGASYSSSGAKNILEKILSNSKITYFNDFEINPRAKDIVRGIKMYQKTNPDIVIAVGGGSVIDVAKAINALAANPGRPTEYVSGKLSISRAGKPLIAIPTTSGSGSEATHFAVVYIGKVKYSLAHKYILPNIAIVDPELTQKLPPQIAASSGFDALAQAIESYWSVNSTAVSRRYSVLALKLIIPNLIKAVSSSDISAKIAMSQASHLAGKAINISKTTACHAISYPITSYFGVPHGHAVGLTLPSLLKFNSEVTSSDVSDKRGVTYVKKNINNLAIIISGEKNIDKAATILDKMMTNVGLETKLTKLNIKAGPDIEKIIKNGFNPDRVKNNPRLLTRKALKNILINLL